jgi:hypothetical protein
VEEKTNTKDKAQEVNKECIEEQRTVKCNTEVQVTEGTS